MKILIVDDSKVMRKMIVAAAKNSGVDGLEFYEAKNGHEGVEVLNSQNDLNLIFTDWNMPEMDGLEFIKIVHKKNPKLMIGFITSNPTDEIKKSAQDAGAFFYLEKPFNEADVIDIVKKAGE